MNSTAHEAIAKIAFLGNKILSKITQTKNIETKEKFKHKDVISMRFHTSKK